MTHATICTFTNSAARGLVALAAAVLMAAVSPVLAAEKPGGAQGGAPTEEEMMAEMMKYSTPGPQHESLKSLAGSWKTETKSWMGPGEPQVSQGTSEKAFILGGRFLEEKFNGNFMGSPFAGFGLTGYDLLRKEYVGMWVDTWSTSIMTTRGQADAAGRKFESKSTFMDPMTKGEKTVRMITQIVDHDTHVFTFFDSIEGMEVKAMEITYRRVK